MPDCGTTFTWGDQGVRAQDRVDGRLGHRRRRRHRHGQPGARSPASYMFQLFGAYGLAASKWWTLGAGVAWIIVMAAICYIGIEISASVQYGLLAIELIMLIVFASRPSPRCTAAAPPAGRSTRPGRGSTRPTLSFSALTSGMLIAIFIYWGWDTAVSVNEETRDKRHAPGRAAVTSTVVLLVTYVLVTVAAQAFAGVGTKGIGLGNPDNSGDVLSVLGNNVFGAHGFGHVPGQAARPHGAQLGGGQHPDHHPAHGPHHPVHGRLPQHPEPVRPYPPPVPDPDLVDGRHGAGVDRLLRAPDPGEPERPGRHHLRHRVDDRLLLRPHRVRVRVVVPPGPAQGLARTCCSRASCPSSGRSF